MMDVVAAAVLLRVLISNYLNQRRSLHLSKMKYVLFFVASKFKHTFTNLLYICIKKSGYIKIILIKLLPDQAFVNTNCNNLLLKLGMFSR